MPDRRQHLASPDHSRPGACGSTPTTQVSGVKLMWATPGKTVKNPQRHRDPRLETYSQGQSFARWPLLRSQSKFQSP